MGPGRLELATPGSAVRHGSVARHVTDCATRHYFVEIDHEIISMVILLLLSHGYKQKHVHKVLVNYLVNLAQVIESVVR